MSDHTYQGDVIIVGGGLAGIAAAFELLDQKLKVLLLERDEPENLGGLARESFGGVMMVDTPLQRRSKIADSPDLACRVLDQSGQPIPGLFAAGETAGFGGGGIHGRGALEGSFLGGCILTGRIAGRAINGETL